MAATVNVLLPTGHRQNVKVTPNTRILQITENVCTKLGWDPNEYNLKHHRSILDPNLSVRYANLPNNCKLELIKADTPRKESAVCLALQVETGERLQHEFDPCASLWDVLVHWETQNSSYAGRLTTSSCNNTDETTSHPVCIYLRQEIVGEAWLKATSLRSLGLTGGKAVIRLLHRAITLPAPPTQPSTKSTAATLGLSHSQPTAGAPSRPSANVPTEGSIPLDKTTDAKTDHVRNQTEASVLAQPSQSSPCEHMEVDDHDTPHTVTEGAGGSLDGNTGDVEKAQDRPGQETDNNLGAQWEKRANNIGAAIAEAIQHHRTEQQLGELKRTMSAPPGRQQAFADFKFPDQAGNQSPDQTDDQSVTTNQHGQITSEPPAPCDRQPLVFSLDQGTSDTGGTTSFDQNIPDDFFEVTINDVRKMMADQRLQNSKDKGEMLQTRAMREASLLEKADKYPRVALRIHFPDRYILQGFFRPRELVGRVRDFVRDHLRSSPTIPFYLYTTPPRYVLTDDAQSLVQAKLFPAAVVHFGSEVKLPDGQHFLNSDLVSEMSSIEKATEDTAKETFIQSEPQSSTSAGHKAKTSIAGHASASRTDPPSTTTNPQPPSKRPSTGETANSDKIPKWFKMGKK